MIFPITANYTPTVPHRWTGFSYSHIKLSVQVTIHYALSNHLTNEQQTTKTSIRRSGATGLALGNGTVSAHPSGQHHPNVTITNSTNPHETQTKHSNLCTFIFTPSSYILQPSSGRDKIQAQDEKCNSPCTCIVSLRDDGQGDWPKHVAGWNKSEYAKVGVLCLVFRVD